MIPKSGTRFSDKIMLKRKLELVSDAIGNDKALACNAAKGKVVGGGRRGAGGELPAVTSLEAMSGLGKAWSGRHFRCRNSGAVIDFHSESPAASGPAFGPGKNIMLQFSLVCRRAFNRAGWLAFVLAAAFLLAPAQRAEAAKCPAQPYPVPAGFGHSGNLGELKLTLINYGCFGDYQRELAQEIASARAFIETRAGEVARPAIVLDIDETSLSNWRALLADDFGYIVGGPCRIGGTAACGMLAWELSAAAEPIVPMVELVRAAQARGVAVFFLTGRNGDAAQRAATARNLRRAGYARWAELIMRAPPEYRLGNAAYKSARRAQIAAKGYAIIANIGDQDSDLAGGYAERTYKLPNPFYFLP